MLAAALRCRSCERLAEILEQIVGRLDPNREPRHVLDQIKQELGSATFEAQYQQQPVPETGGMIQWEWLPTYDVVPTRGPADSLFISWDTALKDREVNDFSVGIVGLCKPNRHIYILDVIRERMNFPALRQRIIEESHRHRGAIHLIEDTGSGTVLLQELATTSIHRIAIHPFGDKVVRLNRASPRIEAGAVHLPARASWLDNFKRELLSFPASANDDQVDALSQLVNHALDPMRGVPLWTSYLS